MNQRLKTTLLVFFALTTLGTGIFAWQQNRQLHASKAAATDSDDSLLRKKLADAEHRAHALQNELDALKAKQPAEVASDEPPTPPNEAEGFGPRGGRFRGGPDSFREIFNDPKVMALMNAREKSMLDQRYAALFKSLIQSGKLTPEQVEAFKNLMVERQNTMRDIRQSAREQGITDRSQVEALMKSTQAELDAQLQNTIGSAAYAEFQAYEKTAPQRNFVSQLAQSLSYGNAPLNDAQSQQLVDILAKTSESNGNRRQGGFGGFGGGGNITVTDAALTAAATVLNPTQLAALAEVQRQQKAQEELRQQLRAARQTNTGAAPSTPAPSGTSTVKVAK
ncbi:MAG: hypothetical protein QM715_20085 [Nibricoccus sp.]